jgi:hypothetical protein
MQDTSITAGLQPLFVPAANSLIQRRGEMEGWNFYMAQKVSNVAPCFQLKMTDVPRNILSNLDVIS